MKKTNERIGKAKFKLIYSIVQMFFFFLALSLFPSYWVLAILVMMISYLVPFYINTYNVKFLNTDTKLKSYILEDTIFYYLPSLALSLLLELILRICGVLQIFDMYLIFTLIFFISFTLLTLFQWLKMFLLFLNIKRIQKANDSDDFEDDDSE